MEIMDTMGKIETHMQKAETKHPDFCRDVTHKNAKALRQKLDSFRRLYGMHGTAEYALMEECYEIFDAFANGDTIQAIDECYDAIIVLMRIIEKLDKQQTSKTEK